MAGAGKELQETGKARCTQGKRVACPSDRIFHRYRNRGQISEARAKNSTTARQTQDTRPDRSQKKSHAEAQVQSNYLITAPYNIEQVHLHPL